MLSVLLDALLWFLVHGLSYLMLCLLLAVLVWVLVSWVRHSCFPHDWRGGLRLGDATTVTFTCAKCGKQRTVSRRG